MKNNMTQPKVSHYYNWLKSTDSHGLYLPTYDESSSSLLDEIFTLIKRIKPAHENGCRSLWFRAERGEIEDFGNAKEQVEQGEVDSIEEFYDIWKSEFPDEIEWYQFDAVEIEDEQYRAIALQHKTIIVQDNRRERNAFPYDISEFVQWILESLKECIAMLESGTYNEFVENNLPEKHRIGTITRKAFWDVWPESRESFFKDISKEDVDEFCKLAYGQPEKSKDDYPRLASMNANDFYNFCALGYKANNYSGCDKTPKDQYYLHADGRDNGLAEIDGNSSDAFLDWLTDRNHFGGHPWEVCRGGNSTHIALCVCHDKAGFYLTLAGSAWNRTIETVKFYLALCRAHLPVRLMEATALADRMMEKEKIGIVPDGVLPAYCENLFPDEHIICFMNLPYEDTKKFIPYCKWQPIAPTELN